LPTLQQEQTGKWLFNTTPVVGDCGSLGSFQGEMINGEVKISSNAGCQVTREVWDSKSCTTIKTFKCYNNGINMRLDWTITSDINNYDRASGILHYVSIDDIQSCTSVYNFTAMKIEN